MSSTFSYLFLRHNIIPSPQLCMILFGFSKDLHRDRCRPAPRPTGTTSYSRHSPRWLRHRRRSRSHLFCQRSPSSRSTRRSSAAGRSSTRQKQPFRDKHSSQATITTYGEPIISSVVQSVAQGAIHLDHGARREDEERAEAVVDLALFFRNWPLRRHSQSVRANCNDTIFFKKSLRNACTENPLQNRDNPTARVANTYLFLRDKPIRINGWQFYLLS